MPSTSLNANSIIVEFSDVSSSSNNKSSISTNKNDHFIEGARIAARKLFRRGYALYRIRFHGL